MENKSFTGNAEIIVKHGRKKAFVAIPGTKCHSLNSCVTLDDTYTMKHCRSCNDKYENNLLIAIYNIYFDV
jgi:hypothetical protein